MIAIELTMTSLAKNPGTSVAPACQVPNPNGCSTVATIEPTMCKKLWSILTLNPPGPA